MNKYRIYFEPMDIEAIDWVDARGRLTSLQYSGLHIPVCKILPIDKDGFPIDL